MLRVGMLTSGGDCQALNAAMRGVAKSLFNQCSEVEIYGFTDGYKGLIYGEYRLLKNDDFSGILNIGGTILGSSRMPFKYIGVPLEDGSDKIERMIDTYKKLYLDCLVVLGGNGSHKTANLLREKGLNFINIQKTIDVAREETMKQVDKARTEAAKQIDRAKEEAARQVEAWKQDYRRMA